MSPTRLEHRPFLQALGKAASIADERSPMPILGNVRLRPARDGQGLDITGSNLEMEITARCPGDWNGPLEGITLPARKLLAITRAADRDLELSSADGHRWTLRAGRGRFTLGGLPAQDFPDLVLDPGEDETLTLPSDILTRMLGMTAPFMAQGDVRFYLNGILLQRTTDGELIAVATDGHRLALARQRGLEPSPTARDSIIPGASVIEIAKIAGESESCALTLAPRHLVLATEHTTVTTKLIDGRYPEYQRVIPQRKTLTHSILFEREELAGMLTRLATVAGKDGGMTIGIGESAASGERELTLSVKNEAGDEAQEALDISEDIPPKVMGYRLSYVQAVAKHASGDHLDCCFEGPDSASLWIPRDAPDELFVIMPMRI